MSYYFRTPRSPASQDSASSPSTSKRRRTTPGIGWQRNGPGATYLEKRFKKWEDGDRVEGIDPTLTDNASILKVFDNHPDLQKYKRSQFFLNFNKTRNNYNIEKEKGGGRAIGNLNKGKFVKNAFLLSNCQFY